MDWMRVFYGIRVGAMESREFRTRPVQMASMIDAKMQKLVCDGNDKLTMLGEMFDYMPGFKRLMDISEPDTMDELCRRFAGFFHYAEILEMVAAGIAGVASFHVPPQPDF